MELKDREWNLRSSLFRKYYSEESQRTTKKKNNLCGSL